ncbi:hypothetical protein LCGC14_0964660 [marine sediment metagenome]|uniref:Uncharacterized protein n=1 Tax=marine sediment metagenome TaxID=412755 RepID=A0A0F9QWN2_9ZZZZ
MSYRPDNWNKQRNEWLAKHTMFEISIENKKIYEAGADALLNALKKTGVFTYGCHTPDIDLDDAPEVNGYWCFIPEEDNEGARIIHPVIV